LSKDGGQCEGNDDHDDNESNHTDQLGISEIEISNEFSGRKQTFVDVDLNREIMELAKEKTKQMEIQLKEMEIQLKLKEMEMKQMQQMEKEKTKQMEFQLKIEKEKTIQMEMARNSQPIVNSSGEEAFTTMAGSLETIQDLSSSSIAKSKRYYYDLFTVPCCKDAYIPNIRLRQLKDNFNTSEGPSVKAYENILINMNMLTTWKYPVEGSEMMVNDPNLKMFLDCISSAYNQDHITSPVTVTKEEFRFLFASSDSKPGWAVVRDRSVLLASIAKGVEASNIAAGLQCFQICADAAIELYRKGLKREDCVVPGVIFCGEEFQIVGVYLVGSTFPVMVNISSLISITHVEVLSRWVGVLKEAISDTVTLLQQSLPRADSGQVRCKLDAGYFYKPIQKRFFLSKMMVIYDKLYHTEGSVEVIQFPLGLISVPIAINTHAAEIRRAVLHCITKFFTKANGDYDNDPCLIFSFLEGWCNTRPDDDHCEAYIKQLSKVINILNLAGVVHMDLTPANIMWKPMNNHDGDRDVQLQVIDFEDALMVGSGVHEELAQEYSKDVRYPIKRGIDCKAIRAKIEFNNFFMDAIEAWLNKSKEKEFLRFMMMNQDIITYYD
jgi:hypothetical protein